MKAPPGGSDASHAATLRIERLCRACVDATTIDGAGVAMVTGAGHRGTVCATDSRAATIEDLQFTLGEGPCVDASSRRSPVLVSDLLDPTEGVADRWPAFLPAAVDIGVRATFAFPVRIGAITLGALDLYRSTAGGLEPAELRSALFTADAVALGLLDVATGSDFGDDGEARSSYRLEVHTAAGMVSVQARISIADALVRLRASAYEQGRSVNDVAADVVGRRLRYTVEES